MRVMELNSSFVPLYWPEDLPQRHMAVTAGTGAVAGFSTGKAVCTRIILFGRACIRTQNVKGSSIHKQASAHTYDSCHSARIYTTAPITHTATLLLELPVSPHGNLSELKIKIHPSKGKKIRVLFSAENPADLKINIGKIYSNQE